MNNLCALDSWSDGWIKEGHFLSYTVDGITYFEQVVQRDFGHWEYTWEENIASGVESGHITPSDLEITKGYDAHTGINQIWQLIWGMKGQVLLYVELPTDTHRHGIPKQPKPNSVNRRVSHFEEWMSPYTDPSFITEHFLMRPDVDRINLSAYNPHAETETDLMLNFFINKMKTERLGVAESGITTPRIERYSEILDKLYRRIVPCKPISLYPVTAPAEAHH